MEESADELSLSEGNFAFGSSPGSLNYKKKGWITKVGVRRVTIKYANGKSATWARKNIVVVPKIEVDEEVKECDLYKDFCLKTSSAFRGFDRKQENTLHHVCDWVRELEDNIKKNNEDIASMGSASRNVMTPVH